MDILGKVIPKLPPFAFGYWDCLLGICCVVIGFATKGVEPTNAFLPFGGALIFWSMTRRQMPRIGLWRSSLSTSFCALVATIFLGFLTWACARLYALDFHLSEPWLRWVLRF